MQSRIAFAFLSNISSLFEYVKILIILIVNKINTYLKYHLFKKHLLMGPPICVDTLTSPDCQVTG